MIVTSDDIKRPVVQNSLWNEKVNQAQGKIVELQALFKYLGFETMSMPDPRHPLETYPVQDVLSAMFLHVTGRRKAM